MNRSTAYFIGGVVWIIAAIVLNFQLKEIAESFNLTYYGSFFETLPVRGLIPLAFALSFFCFYKSHQLAQASLLRFTLVRVLLASLNTILQVVILGGAALASSYPGESGSLEKHLLTAIAVTSILSVGLGWYVSLAGNTHRRGLYVLLIVLPTLLSALFLR